ncbi:MAG: hypothetical protein IBX55_18655 [Methyloprofundus sp.]|nr:hypothetical protein [Methyloprofundus sp.]
MDIRARLGQLHTEIDAANNAPMIQKPLKVGAVVQSMYLILDALEKRTSQAVNVNGDYYGVDQEFEGVENVRD